MKLEEFLNAVRNLPVITTEILLTGVSNIEPIRVQLSRWQRAGKLIQVKRGIYLLTEPYRKVNAYEPYLASILKTPSYISLEKALEYHGLIPEAVSVYTSVTTKRQGRFISEAGVFDYRHIKNSLFWGYESITVNKQTGFIASPEKALLDLVYLNNLKITLDYLREMRLQNVEKINLKKLLEYAGRFKSPGILHASETIKGYIVLYKGEEKTL